MVRHYKMKGQKKRKREEKHDKEGEEEFAEQSDKSTPQDENLIEEDNKEVGVSVSELPSIPIVLTDTTNSANKPGAIFILEKASLEVAKVGKTYQLLNSDKHAHFLKKNGRNPAEYRPDIIRFIGKNSGKFTVTKVWHYLFIPAFQHSQAIMMILDSTLNKSGCLKALYVKTEKGVLFEIKPHVRIPRTFDRFAGLMLQLLQKLSITAVGFSHSSEKLVNMHDYVAAVSNEVDLVFVVGAMAHEKVDVDYIEDFVSVSNYPLSAAYCISRICNAVEQNLGVL